MDTKERKSIERRHFSIREPKVEKILKVEKAVMDAARNFLDEEGFLQIIPPVTGPATDPGLRGAKIGEFGYYGRTHKLISSMILHKQMAMAAFGRIYSLSPCVRLEPSESAKTGRHLSEFWQIEVEASGWDYEKIMELGERMLCAIVEHVKDACKEEL